MTTDSRSTVTSGPTSTAPQQKAANGRSRRQGNVSRRRTVKKLLNTAAMALVAFLFTVPFFWMFLTALKPQDEVFAYPPTMFGSKIRWQNFVDAWTLVPFGRFIANGFFVAAAGALLSMIRSEERRVGSGWRSRWA